MKFRIVQNKKGMYNIECKMWFCGWSRICSNRYRGYQPQPEFKTIEAAEIFLKNDYLKKNKVVKYLGELK